MDLKKRTNKSCSKYTAIPLRYKSARSRVIVRGNKREVVFWALGILYFLCQSAYSFDSGYREFSIHLLNEDFAASVVLHAVKKSDVQIEKVPLITQKDVLSADQQELTITLTSSSYDRLAALYCLPHCNWTGNKNETRTINTERRRSRSAEFIGAAGPVNWGGML